MLANMVAAVEGKIVVLVCMAAVVARMAAAEDMLVGQHTVAVGVGVVVRIVENNLQ